MGNFLVRAWVFLIIIGITIIVWENSYAPMLFGTNKSTRIEIVLLDSRRQPFDFRVPPERESLTFINTSNDH